ncbi:porin [Pseudoduganella violaceinigra]|uniref:porin n=1 Tax=Pseudoduganella violaceinigra TaxID=246602 RepID=UPI00040B3104|nr:porin [Pseudoduganella violaceinigra]
MRGFLCGVLLASLAASAAAQGTALVYGRINLVLAGHAGYGPEHGHSATENSLSSKLGIKGREALTDTLAATYVIETGIGADTGGGSLGNRETSVGLAGNWGQLRIGYMLAPFDDFHNIAGPGYFNNLSNDNINGFWANGYSNLLGAGSKPCDGAVPGTDDNNNFSFDGRLANSLRYDGPVLRGWQFSTHMALGESGCGTRVWSSKLHYTANGWNGGLAFQTHRNLRGPGLSDHAVLLTASYRFNPNYYLAGYLQHLRYANPGRVSLRQEAAGILGRYLSGPHIMELAMYRAGGGRGMQTPTFSGIFVGSDARAYLYSLTYHYGLSVRTDLWAQVEQLRNGAQSGYDFGNTGKAGAEGTMGRHPIAFLLGLRHDF